MTGRCRDGQQKSARAALPVLNGVCGLITATRRKARPGGRKGRDADAFTGGRSDMHGSATACLLARLFILRDELGGASLHHFGSSEASATHKAAAADLCAGREERALSGVKQEWSLDLGRGHDDGVGLNYGLLYR